MAALVVAPGSAAAQGLGLDLNLIVQALAAQSSTDETVSNDADINLFDTDGKGAAANCQWAIGYNVEAASVAAVDGFALIDDNDKLELETEIGRALGYEAGDDAELDTRTANASCEQVLGTFRVVDDSSDGWGSPAPNGDALSALAGPLSAAWGGLGDEGLEGDGIGGGLGGGNVIVNLASAGSFVDDTVVNDAYLDLSDSDGIVSAANCQWVVGVNVVATSASFAKAVSKIHDDDEAEIEEELGDPYVGADGGIDVTADDDIEDDSKYATSSCKQTVDLMEFFLGGAKRIEPES